LTICRSNLLIYQGIQELKNKKEEEGAGQNVNMIKKTAENYSTGYNGQGEKFLAFGSWGKN